MKKIVALALCLVLALSLATVAFAETQYVIYPATSANIDGTSLTSTATTVWGATAIQTIAATTNTNGSGSLECMQIGDSYFVKTTTPTTSDFAVVAAGKTEILYYVTKLSAFPAYETSAKAFTDFGSKCGQVFTPVTGASYYVDADDTVYVGATAGEVSLLVDGKIVKADEVTLTTTLTAGCQLDHKFVVSAYKYDTAKSENVPTEATCVNCGMKTTAVYKDGKAPAGSDPYELNVDGYVVVPTASTAATTAGVTSAKTFDAGVALYAGMALMSVAGSAVVIGKKKEF